MEFDAGSSNLAKSGLEFTSQFYYQPHLQQIAYSPAVAPATVPTETQWQPNYTCPGGLNDQCVSQIVDSPSQPCLFTETSSLVPHSRAKRSMRPKVLDVERQLILLELDTVPEMLQADSAGEHDPPDLTSMIDVPKRNGNLIIGMSRLNVPERCI